MSIFDITWYKGKRVLITGHTGFKGSWMCKLLINAGADVTGYALEAVGENSLFHLCGIAGEMNSVIGDVRDLQHMLKVFEEVKPEIVIHMAAQPIVRDSYKRPVYTYDVNVMGTVNILECVRLTDSVKSFVNVTTDKVYLNREWQWGYRENEELNGFDPYSNSKSCSELVTGSYKNSFFCDGRVAISTVRAGNVIGGGDFAVDRIVPDCIRAAQKEESIVVRNPYSTRPYEHVLEPIVVYLMLAKAQYEDISYAGSYNVGPDESDCYATGDLVTLFCEKWNKGTGASISWRSECDNEMVHEARYLKLDCSKLKTVFDWKPHWNVETAMEKIVEWTKVYLSGGDVSKCMDVQIEKFLEAGI